MSVGSHPVVSGENDECEPCDGSGRVLRGLIDCPMCEGSGIGAPMSLDDLAQQLRLSGIVEQGPIKRALYLWRGRMRSLPMLVKAQRLRE